MPSVRLGVFRIDRHGGLELLDRLLRLAPVPEIPPLEIQVVRPDVARRGRHERRVRRAEQTHLERLDDRAG